MSVMDKVMDSEPSENHEFLKTVDRLVKLKTENPKIRLSGPNPLRESIVVSEEEKVGMRGPKRKFLELSKYEQRFGPAPPHQIKCITFKGQKIRGVDIINEEDESCHDGDSWYQVSNFSLSDSCEAFGINVSIGIVCGRYSCHVFSLTTLVPE